jgi:hypothetical protein
MRRGPITAGVDVSYQRQHLTLPVNLDRPVLPGPLCAFQPALPPAPGGSGNAGARLRCALWQALGSGRPRS